jgi:putative pyruvate formate lyase activating enzyme
MLERYKAVDENRKYALHWIAGSMPPGVDKISEATDDELFEANRRQVERLRVLARMPAPDLELPEESLLDLKLELARRLLADCCFCERRCGADRVAGEKGYCGVGARSRYSSDFLHMGEEAELVPSHTIFFSGCNFRCAYCQNWDIATHPESGRTAEPAMLSAVILEGMSQGSRNVNFVGGNPDPNLHTIIETVRLLGNAGRFLPMVWNSNMYTSLESMRLLDGVIDVYLGDFRYGNDACARRLSDVEGYFDVTTRNFAFAYETADVMLRHLVLPGHLECCTRPIMEWVSRNMKDVYFNLMFQYRPEHRAGFHQDIDRLLNPEERSGALEMARSYGIETF